MQDPSFQLAFGWFSIRFVLGWNVREGVGVGDKFLGLFVRDVEMEKQSGRGRGKPVVIGSSNSREQQLPTPPAGGRGIQEMESHCYKLAAYGGGEPMPAYPRKEETTKLSQTSQSRCYCPRQLFTGSKTAARHWVISPSKPRPISSFWHTAITVKIVSMSVSPISPTRTVLAVTKSGVWTSDTSSSAYFNSLSFQINDFSCSTVVVRPTISNHRFVPIVDSPKPLQSRIYNLAAKLVVVRSRSESQALLSRSITGFGKTLNLRLFTRLLNRSIPSASSLTRSVIRKQLATQTLRGTVVTPNYTSTSVSESLTPKFLYQLDQYCLNGFTQEERSLHVFYHFIAGCTSAERDAFTSKDPLDYTLLASSGTYRLPVGPFGNDSVAIGDLRAAMRTFGFKPKAALAIFGLLIIHLLLENLEFGQGIFHDVSAHVANVEVLLSSWGLLQRSLGSFFELSHRSISVKTIYMRSTLNSHNVRNPHCSVSPIMYHGGQQSAKKPSATATPPQGGIHPLCEFCHECFFSEDEVYTPMRERHEECFVVTHLRNSLRTRTGSAGSTSRGSAKPAATTAPALQSTPQRSFINQSPDLQAPSRVSSDVNRLRIDVPALQAAVSATDSPTPPSARPSTAPPRPSGPLASPVPKAPVPQPLACAPPSPAISSPPPRPSSLPPHPNFLRPALPYPLPSGLPLLPPLSPTVSVFYSLLTSLPAQLLIPTFYSLPNIPPEAGTVGPESVIMPITISHFGMTWPVPHRTVKQYSLPQLVMNVSNLLSYEGWKCKTTLPLLENSIVRKTREMPEELIIPIFTSSRRITGDGSRIFRQLFLSMQCMKMEGSMEGLYTDLADMAVPCASWPISRSLFSLSALGERRKSLWGNAFVGAYLGYNDYTGCSGYRRLKKGLDEAILCKEYIHTWYIPPSSLYYDTIRAYDGSTYDRFVEL
ncbi:hypothetical protein BDP27DRAFT_1364292 [Rhodocollybia butyracea]|uniref:Myosin motor domain-containing protein n=1 Tax=Rhodocollybia butyracea TaxID=206335 RepID=A0A9P5PRK7_9AGAR|nr:hypothetical protein BDP27DRAFT_1364292 [Rhodocollybia butyracea]